MRETIAFEGFGDIPSHSPNRSNLNNIHSRNELVPLRQCGLWVFHIRTPSRSKRTVPGALRRCFQSTANKMSENVHTENGCTPTNMHFVVHLKCTDNALFEYRPLSRPHCGYLDIRCDYKSTSSNMPIQHRNGGHRYNGTIQIFADLQHIDIPTKHNNDVHCSYIYNATNVLHRVESIESNIEHRIWSWCRWTPTAKGRTIAGDNQIDGRSPNKMGKNCI